jgi:curved DNA-binding protein CbpA
LVERSSEKRTIAKGDLAKTPFAHLLVYLDRRELSGSLAVWPDADPGEIDDADLILFRGGWPVGACFKRQADSLEKGLLGFFTRERAGYAFFEGNLLAGRRGRLDGKIDPLALVAQSLRTATRDEVVDSVVKRLGDARLRIQPRAEIARFKLDPKEKGLVELLQAEPAGMEALIRGTALPERRSKRLVYLLLITNAVTIYEPPAEQPEEAEADREPSFGFRAEEPSSQPPAAGARPSHRAEPEKAPARFSMAPDDEQVGAEAPPSGRPPSGRAPEEPLAPNMNIAHDSRLDLVPPPPQSLPLESKRRWLEIKNTVENIEHLNYFQMLGVKKEAPPDEVRDAFFALAKKWHPDRLPADLQQLKPQVEAVFAYFSEAHVCLIDDEQRAAYLQSVREGGGTPAAERLMQRTIEGAMSFQKVEVLARQHRYDEALDLLNQIIEMTGGEPEYHATYAWLLLQKHQGVDAPFDLMLASIDKAIKVDKKHEKAHFTRGLILKRMGRNEEALRHFKLVAEINPKNVDAVREVRIASMRKGTGEKARGTEEGSGLFSGLFKKK